MSPQKRRLLEDRAMRDAARELVNHQVAWFKAGAGEPGFASHVLETGKDYARTVADGAIDLAQEHRGKLSGGLAITALAAAAWIYREQLGELVAGMLDGFSGDDDDTDNDTAEQARQ